ncbi:MAG: rhomboid family intramembrane serine protease [Bacteroidales bacterium]|nr:rhomboid family intramembrane serine protease [Bacteroidales bacterium]
MLTLIIVITTSIISIIAFNKTDLFNKYQLNPYLIYHKKQYYRLLSHGFLHTGWLHLIVNMLVFYSFGNAVEIYFKRVFIYPNLYFLLLYFGGILISTLTTLIKYKNDHLYNAVGASGAVSAIVFTSIFFNPWNKIYFYGIIGIPGILLGVIYLIYSYYMSKKDIDNINHNAHFIGAVFGLVFPCIIDYNLFWLFINQLFN